jgi:hypothetical protein
MIAFRGEVLGRLTSPGSSPDWLYPEGYFDDSSEIRCGDEYVDGCSDRDPFAVTWCVNLWHPTELIQVCINSTGTYSSPAAEQLGIMQNFAIIESCPNYYAGFFGPASFKGCLRINKVKSYYAGAIFTCTALTDTCYNQNFFNFGVAYEQTPPELTMKPPLNQFAVLGSNLLIECVYSSPTSVDLYSLYWKLPNGTSLAKITEDPLCNSVR